MSEQRAGGVRTIVVTYFPMFIATLSLVTAIFNGYLNSKFLDIIQRNVARGEYMRTCKEVIDAYFLIKARVKLMGDAREREGRAADTSSPYYVEAVSAVSRFGALGTYLANLRDEKVRARYTDLTDRLQAIVREAAEARGAPDKLFAPADEIFAEMNDDCVKSAKNAQL